MLGGFIPRLAPGVNLQLAGWATSLSIRQQCLNLDSNTPYAEKANLINIIIQEPPQLRKELIRMHLSLTMYRQYNLARSLRSRGRTLSYALSYLALRTVV